MSTRLIILPDTVWPALGATRRTCGFTLIELMIAMVLGLIVISGVISVFLASQQSYRTNQALGDVQDGSRMAFELMARDIRDAGLTGCNNNGRVANVLKPSAVNWWADWGNAVHGYGATQTDPAVAIGTVTGTRVAGTDSLTLLGAAGGGLSVAKHNPVSAQFDLNGISNLQPGDVIIACDPDHAVITQVTGPSSTGAHNVVHNTGNSVSPGNCSKGLGYPTDCSSTNGNSYQFGPNSQIFTLAVADWYIGNNGTGSSLYRKDVETTGGTPTPTAQEMVRGVTGMAISYHQTGGVAFALPAAVTDWSTVDAVQVKLTLESSDKRAGTDIKPITRFFTATTTVRNRVN